MNDPIGIVASATCSLAELAKKVEDAKEKATAMETYWVPGVNHAGRYGRWAFAELTEQYQIQADFAKKVASEFDKMIDRVANMIRRGRD